MNIMNMISLPVWYRGKEYYSLVRFVGKQGYSDIRVTIMNGELEAAMSGHNVFQFRNGFVVADLVDNECIQRELQMAILDVLDGYLANHRNELEVLRRRSNNVEMSIN
jgi:hypothetical protein